MCLAIPGQIEKILSDEELARSALVNFSGIKKTVNITFVPEAMIGDYVIVHVGVAISKLNTEEAQRIFKDLKAVDGE